MLPTPGFRVGCHLEGPSRLGRLRRRGASSHGRSSNVFKLTWFESGMGIRIAVWMGGYTRQGEGPSI
jgi:hypothetical protein